MDTRKFKHIILVDTESFDEVAFDIIVNFERMLNRKIPRVDMCRWIYAAACDGKFPANSDSILAIFLKRQGQQKFANLNFRDIAMCEEIKQYGINGFNFCVKFEEYSGNSDHAFVDMTEKLLGQNKDMEDLVCIPNEDIAQYAARLLSGKRDLRSTVLSQESLRGGGFSQEYLSCSISYALGITDSEIENMEHL